MKEDKTTGYDGEGIRPALWSAFGVGTAAAAKYVLGDGLFGGGRPPTGTPPWARDLEYERQLTVANAEIGQLKAEKYADAATLVTERRLTDKIDKIEATMQAGFRAQGEYNVANTAAVASISNQTHQLMKMTNLIIAAPAFAESQAAASVFTAKVTAQQGSAAGG